jgi:hypothetical protein
MSTIQWIEAFVWKLYQTLSYLLILDKSLENKPSIEFRANFFKYK